jgi:hypothetical protein
MSQKHMSIAEFIDEGYLHEVNRRFLHPLGLALEVTVDDDGSTRLSGIQDSREHLDGMIFAEDTLSVEKAQKVEVQEMTRRPFREHALGYWIQPLPE